MRWSTIASLALALVLVGIAFGLVRAARPAVRRLGSAPLLRSAGARGRAGLSWLTVRVTARVLILAAGSAVVFALASLFVEILEAVVDGDDLTAIDRPAVQWIASHRTGWLSTVMVAVTDLGGTVLLATGLTIAAAAVAHRLRSWRPVLLTAVAAGGCALLVAVIKVIIGRDRPDPLHRAVTEDGFSFPSGHSASALAGLAMVVWLVYMVTANRTARATAWLAAGLLTVAIGLSRIYLGVHYPSDVLGGWALGATWFLTVALAAGRYPAGPGVAPGHWRRMAAGLRVSARRMAAELPPRMRRTATGLPHRVRRTAARWRPLGHRAGTVGAGGPTAARLVAGRSAGDSHPVSRRGPMRRSMVVLAVAAIAAFGAIVGMGVTLAVTDPLAPPAVGDRPPPATDGSSDGSGATAVPVISVAEARAIALRRAGDGQTTEVELEWEHGVLVWSVDVMKLAVEYDVDIDATTGAVLWYGPDN